jgi:hypothetical protein
VVFVDIDPVAVAHSRLILEGNDRAAVIQEDVRRPELISSAPEMRLLDLDQPVAVLLVSLLHFVSDIDDPPGILSRLTAPLVSGSYLAFSHGTNDGPRDMAVGTEIYRQAGIDVTLRNRSVVEALFDGFDLVEPRIVWTPQWRPESPGDPYYDQPDLSTFYAGVGRKR